MDAAPAEPVSSRPMDAFMLAAIEEAEQGVAEGGIPIGSVVVHDGTIVGRGHNRRVQQASTILHGEMDALERAGRRPGAFYKECTLYTTRSPPVRCAAARSCCTGFLAW